MPQIPYGVRSCLFTGISHNIAFLTKQVETILQSGQGTWKSYDTKLHHEVKEALEWYQQYAVKELFHVEEDLRAFEQLLTKVHQKKESAP
ncbi:hypothetical protein JOC54_003941 [Alkalihalobacillus xiaoxiensis]|uniref:Uncharacterized protein n=1 Tax=Shouchella xiaoxiensis TaxID=766895 RepID=A0ABS2SYP2_9BACI|nr:hypothetical protein [Shouchella xiaoxiensis]MBM7840648.1 hypothetical protein [Shouchella xiaoxiensis]